MVKSLEAGDGALKPHDLAMDPLFLKKKILVVRLALNLYT